MRSLLASASAFALTSVLVTGCGGFSNTAALPPSQVALSSVHGALYGGQQPVSGSSIQLYQVGTTGYGTGATPLLTSAVVTDSAGSFALTGKYSCTAGTQVYITATGGNPGTTAGTNNTALAMMAGLGLCDNLTASTYIFINEVTSVAAVWALSPFMTGTTAAVTVGAPSSNQSGLATAFSDIAQLANNSSGTTPGTALPSGATAPVAEINTLADILAGCVNSSSGASAACSALFTNATPPGGTAPANTLAAALNIARNPGQNVAALVALAAPTAPFQPTLLSANDLTLGVTYTVGSTPASVAVDAGNNVWVVNNASSSVSKLTHAGVPTTYTTGLNLPTSIAIDSGGNAWVTNTNNSLTQISATTGNGTNYTGGGLNAPTAIAIDGFGMIWAANGGSTTLSAFSNLGSVISGSPFSVAPANGTGEVSVGINPR